jgi:hypothetical protein
MPFTDCLLGTAAFETITATIYPNPNSGRFTIVANQNAVAEIYNINGQLLFSKDLVAGENTVDLGLPTGVYVVKTISEFGIATDKIVRQ